jgi:lipopolysaccharide transport system permease protein
VVFSAIFGLIRGSFSGIEALLFFMAGLVPWTSFQNGVQMAATSLEQNANLVSKVYFPRMTVPASQVISSLVDFLIAFATLLIIAAVGHALRPELILWMFPLLLIQTVAAMGLSLFFAVLNAQYRDVKYTIPFLLQLGMFITVWIPLEDWRRGEVGLGEGSGWLAPYLYQLLSLNPMAGVVETYRAVLGGEAVNWVLLGKGTVVSCVLLLVGARFFSAREKRLVDIL